MLGMIRTVSDESPGTESVMCVPTEKLPAGIETRLRKAAAICAGVAMIEETGKR